MSSRLLMRTLLCVALGIPLAFALFTPRLLPEVEFDGIPLIKSDTIYVLLVSAIVLLPFVVALVCSGESRTDREREIARGIAIGSGASAVTTLLLSTLVALYGLTWAGSSNGVWAMRLFACLALTVINIALVWTALRGPGRSITGTSGLAAVSVVAYAILIFFMFKGADELAQRRARTYRHRMDTNADAAESAVRSATFCAMNYLAADPARKIPDGLESLVRVAGCNRELLDPRITPEYRLTFSSTPRSKPGIVSDGGCLAIATFTGGRLPDGRGSRFSDGRTITGNCSGVLLEREQRYENNGGYMVGGVGPGVTFDSLLPDLEEFAAGARPNHYPTTLAELREKTAAAPRAVSDYLMNQAPTDLSQNTIRWGLYVLRYVPEPAGGVATAAIVNFHVDVRCEPYGPKCMRNYLLDSQGFVHGTGQNRGATDEDPIIEACELHPQTRVCNGEQAPRVRRKRH
jgi:hypothetical protein